MGHFPFVLAIAAALFCAFILNLAARPRTVSRLTAIAFAVTGVGGLLCYGYGYAAVCGSLPLAAVRAALSTAYAFLGRNDFSAVSDAPFFQTALGQTLFWVLHMVALYTTASAIFITAGAGILRRLRLLAALRGDLVLIYGTHDGAISFGRQMAQRRKTSVVFVDPSPAPGSEDAVRAMGTVLRSDSSAVEPDRRFLRSVGIRGSRRVFLYALSRDSSVNSHYAASLLRALEAAHIPSTQTSLTMLGYEDSLHNDFLSGNNYGYGSVTVLDEAEMAARLLVRHAPPFRALTFDKEGCAQQDLHCLLIGFGHVGQAVLRNVTINGQFLGSTFHAAVFAPNCSSVSGLLSVQSKGLMDQYDITLHDHDARSKHLYEHLDELGSAVNYVAVCTGNDTLNREIAEDLLHYFDRRGHSIPICLCSRSGVQQMRMGTTTLHWPLYSPEILCTDALDRRARLLNHIYCKNSLTPEENWQNCSYLDRMSSRAAADFLPAFLHMAGVTTAEVRRDGWDPQEPLLTSLAKTEHLRWCAFYYAMGFSPMDEEIHLSRARIRAEEAQRTGSSKFPVNKDLERRLHICLVPWDKLKGLDEREQAITGRDPHYRTNDYGNVAAAGQLSDEDTDTSK